MPPGYLVSRLISSYIGYMIVMGVLALVVPKFQSLFNDFTFQVPWSTQVLLHASDLCLRYYLWALCIPLPAIWAMANVSIADKYRRRHMRLLAFVFVCSFLIFTLAALFFPTMHLIDQMPGRPNTPSSSSAP